MGMKNIFSFFDCNIVEIWNKTIKTRKEIAIQEPYLLCLRDIYKHTTTAWAVNIFTFHLLYFTSNVGIARIIGSTTIVLNCSVGQPAETSALAKEDFIFNKIFSN